MKTATSILTALMLMPGVSAVAQPGSLDSTFGINGKVLQPGGSAGSNNHSLTIQPDGKLIIAGNVSNGTNSDFLIVRYKANGSLDKSFGLSGKVITDFGNDDYANAVAIQSNGKIIVTGKRGYDFAMARYNKNGKVDSSFGTNGKVSNSDLSGGNDIAIQPDGKILVVGNGVYIARYKSNGTLDKGFGNKGIVYTDITDPPEHFGGGYAASVCVQPDGKILLGGYNQDEMPGRGVVIVRYKPNGEIDSSFGNSGQVHWNSIHDEGANSVYALADGKVIMAGFSIHYAGGETYDFLLIRLKTDGSFDSSFGNNGFVTTDFNNRHDFGNSLCIQQDGKIIVAGYTSDINYTDFNFALARYKPNGKPDKTFGKNGKTITDFGNDDYGYSVAQQADGKIVVAGTSGSKFALARYKGDEILLNENTDNISSSQAPKSSLIKTYPNPVQSFLKIEFKNAGLLKIIVNIYDVNGKLLISKSAEDNTQLDLKQLTAGTYLIKITDEEDKELYSSKVIKR